MRLRKAYARSIAGPALVSCLALALGGLGMRAAFCQIPVSAPAQGDAFEETSRSTTALIDEISALSTRIQREIGLLARTTVPGEEPKPSASLVEMYVALAGVQVDKAREHLAATPPDPAAAEECLRSSGRLLELKNADTPPTFVRQGRYVEHAYIARNDSSPQPYYIYVPSSYTPDRSFPLMIFLHGWDPALNRIHPWLIIEEVLNLAEERQVLFVTPYGRSNTDFQFCGEVDVLRVKAEVERFYNIDPDRVYLTGASMGAAGVWEIGTHYPHLFAGLAPINGQADWFLFWRQHFGYPSRLNLPQHIRFLIGMNNPVDLARNLGALYSYSEHATLCWVGVEHTRRMCRELQKSEASYETFEDPSPLGHASFFDMACWRRVFPRLTPLVRSAAPRRFQYKTFSLRYAKAYWMEIEQIHPWGTPATVAVNSPENGQIVIQSENVAAVRLSPPRDWSATDGQYRIRWNDREVGRRALDPQAGTILRLPGVPSVDPGPFRKTRAVCGPAADVFNFPFVGVIGTSGNAVQTATNEELARQFAQDWLEYAAGCAEIIRDVDVTEATVKEKGLVLFGDPGSNLIIERIKHWLPFRISADSVILPDGTVFSDPHLGLILTYFNPLAPDRYILIYNGVPWGAGRSNNHKFDMLPDFAIFTPDNLPPLGINRYMAAGFFDEFWQYDPSLTDLGAGTEGFAEEDRRAENP